MDGSTAIESNRVALVRIVASLIAMAGMGERQSGAGSRQSEKARVSDVSSPSPTADCRLPTAPTLPRHLWLAIVRLLRPAEAAARRLIIAAARGIVVPPPRVRKAAPKPETTEPLLRRLGIAVMVSPARIAEAAAATRRAKADRARAGRFLPCPEPVEGAGEGDHAQRSGGGVLERRIPASALFDPLRRLSHEPAEWPHGRRHAPARVEPRILFPGVTEPSRLPPTPPPLSPDDPVSAARLGQRLASLADALDDLPRQARRFARWKAARDAEGTQNKNGDAEGTQNKNRDAEGAQNKNGDAGGARPVPGRFRRISPLRGGPPPGCRLARWDPYRDAAGARRRCEIREIDEILAHAHELAIYALGRPDTS